MHVRKVIQLSVLVTAATISVAAQTKINYGSEYKCGNERVIVYYCRNDPGNDGGQPVDERDNYCSVEYPDRPRRNPMFAVAGSVVRSDLLKLFSSCAAAPSADPAVAKAQAAKVDTEVFGIQLGDPFTIPACPMFQAGAGPKTCRSSMVDLISDLASTPGNVVAEAKTVYLAADQCPSWVDECTLHVQAFAGKIGYIGVFTKGPGVDSIVRKVLAEKYGKWSLANAATITPGNTDRQPFKIMEYRWSLPGLYIHYQPVWSTPEGETPDLNGGLIRIETETGRKARLDAAAKAPKKKM